MKALRKLFGFHGGVKPDSHKQGSSEQAIQVAPLPSRLVVPLHQSVGGSAQALVEPGQKVLKGERIGAADGNLSAAVHAPSSGTVQAIDTVVLPHPSGLTGLAVVIIPDGEDRWAPCEPVRHQSLPADEVRDILRDAGVVGLGGAVFPSHLKLKPGREGSTRTLILNGAECEPFITCDDRLMRERSTEILRGAQLMRALLHAEEVIIGIEDNKPAAIAAMQCAAAGLDASLQIQPIPTRYPAGGAKQLIRVLTGIEVPHGKRSTDYGVQCFNVGTAYAIQQALEQGHPMLSRIVTVTGNVERPGNYEVLLGTPMNEVVALAGARPDSTGYLMGGPMMGMRMPHLEVPVVKATNCILVSGPELFAAPPPEQACIRCGACAQACPADLQPFELYWFSRARNFGKAQEYHLFDCIECGCCAYVCPSHIPLVDYYRFSKSEIWAREREKTAADQARERFEFRNFRQEREKQEKAEKLAAKAAETREKLGVDTPVAEDPKKALIAAALARAQAQKQQVQARNTSDLSDAANTQIAEIDARRAEPAPHSPTDPA